MWRDLFRFGMVGGIGFLVDAAALSWLLREGNTVIFSRGVSFGLAVSVTYLLNRSWTFSSNRRARLHREYLAYLAIQVVGAGINLGVFFIYLKIWPSHVAYPVLPLAAGAIVAMMFNFLASRRLVFTRMDIG